jgi:CubicO group peptidase (beta-lactamase class C family)
MWTKDGREEWLAEGVGAGNRPLDRDSILEIGSISKVFTAVLALEMTERGEIDLDSPVSRYLTRTKLSASDAGRRITLRSLMTQSSGLPRMPANIQISDPLNPYADYTAEEVYDFVATFQLSVNPGQHYEYSNLGFGLLGHALAAAGNKTFERLLKERVIDPLEMRDTYVGLKSVDWSRVAPGHSPDGKEVPNWVLPAFEGAGALLSTPRDMSRFIHASLGRVTGLPPSLMRALQRATEPQLSTSPQTSIAFGWQVRRRPSGDQTCHNGGTGGYRSLACLSRQAQAGVVLMANIFVSVDELGFKILDYLERH